MPEPNAPSRKVSDKSTKQEILDAYQALLKQQEQKRAAELAPQRRLEEKQADAAVKVAGALSATDIDREIGNLKAEVAKLLAEISAKLADETGRFQSVQRAVEAKQRELQELYGIERAASSLAALIEAQNLKRHEFEQELAEQKAALEREIESRRAEWIEERQRHDAEIKERDATEKKTREREKEEFLYAFKREQQSVKDRLNDEKTTLEKELKSRRESAEKDLAEREKNLAAREQELAELRAKAAAFPKELEGAVAKAVKETTDRLKAEAKSREDLLLKEAEGERKVLNTQIAALEKALKECADQNNRLSRQLEAAYQKVQDIAEKTIEGVSQAKSLADLQKLLAEQSRKPGPEKS